MQIIINDANILIDLLDIELIDSFFQLPYQMHSTEEVLSEVKVQDKTVFDFYIETNQFVIKAFEYREILSIKQLLDKFSALSFQDCGCFYYSDLLSSPLLTGDKNLRKVAEKQKITVYGILWVFDQLILHQVITKKEAHKKLSDLMAKNSRLPKNECLRRLMRWEKEQS